MFFIGTKTIDDEINTIKEALILKSGLIESKKEPQFKKQLKKVMDKEFVVGLAEMSAAYRQR